MGNADDSSCLTRSLMACGFISMKQEQHEMENKGGTQKLSTESDVHKKIE